MSNPQKQWGDGQTPHRTGETAYSAGVKNELGLTVVGSKHSWVYSELGLEQLGLEIFSGGLHRQQRRLRLPSVVVDPLFAKSQMLRLMER